MSVYLASHPRVLGLLRDAKRSTEEDGLRLVLADFLEDHGDLDRAEFIRLQCRPRPHDRAGRSRRQGLLDLHGGAWLGPLWRWRLSPVCWHRGLLSCGLPTGFRHEDVGPTLPWIDTVVLSVTGRKT